MPHTFPRLITLAHRARLCIPFPARRGLLCLLLASLGLATAQAAEPDWSAYDGLLKKYVSRGTHAGTTLSWVDYTALKADPSFPQVIAAISEFPLDRLANDKEKLAYHINLYNLLALKMVLDHWPVKSIKDAGNLLSPVWKKEIGQLGGKPITLDALEHQILRPMGDPRVHMAIVCASVSCPDLRLEPYTAARLDEQMDDQAKQFLNNPEKGLRLDGDTAHTSKIFQWFEEDFTKGGGVLAFLQHYHTVPEKTEIKTDLDYNWSVNGQ